MMISERALQLKNTINTLNNQERFLINEFIVQDALIKNIDKNTMEHIRQAIEYLQNAENELNIILLDRAIEMSKEE